MSRNATANMVYDAFQKPKRKYGNRMEENSSDNLLPEVNSYSCVSQIELTSQVSKESNSDR